MLFRVYILSSILIFHHCTAKDSNATEASTIAIKLGGLFYENTAEHYAFLRAIEDVNSNPMLLNGYHLDPIVAFHDTNWIIEAMSVLSQNPSAVIAPPFSSAVKQISPLFTLTTTPLIGYSSTASILSDTDIFPLYYGVEANVRDLVGPILALFEIYQWKQAVLLHGAGAWGHGLDGLIYAAHLLDITFPVIIQIPDDATQSDIETLLSGDAELYEVYIVHATSALRENLFAAANKLRLLTEGKAWLGSEDIATSAAHETESTIHFMEGMLAVRPKTPNTWQSNRLRDNITAQGIAMTYYAYYAYDAVVAVAHALNWRVNQSDNVTQHEALLARDYFGNITMKCTNGPHIGAAMSTLQLPPSWMMTDALYMSDNRRKTSYELVNFVGGSLEIVGSYAWSRQKVGNYFQGLLAGISVGSRNASMADECVSLDWTAQTSDKTQWNQMDRLFSVHEKALTTHYLIEYQANIDVIRLWNDCYRVLLGLDKVYTLSDKSDDYDMYSWSIDGVMFSGNTSSIPVGALWKISEAMRVLCWLIPPWGTISIPEEDMDGYVLPSTKTLDTYSGQVDVDGFLPTVWHNVTTSMGIQSIYYWVPGLSANDVIELVSAGEYDVALGAFTITNERTNLVNFIQQFHGGGLKILSKKPGVISTSWMFLKPFDWSLWLASALTIVFVAGVIYILEWDTDTFYDEDERMSLTASFVEAVTISSSVLFYTHEPPKGIHTRVFVLVFQYMILVWIAAYTANMASFLTKSEQAEPQVVAFNDLYAETTRVSTLRGGYSHQVLLTKSVTIEFVCNTTDECVEFVRADNTDNETSNVFVFDDVNVDYWAQSSDAYGCDLVAPGDVFNSVSFAFPTTYNLIPQGILSQLNVEMVSLWSRGMITQWIEQYVAPQGGCAPYVLSEGSDTESISTVNMAELFIFIAAFSICFCCMLLCQPKIQALYQSVLQNREYERERQQTQQQQQHDPDNVTKERAALVTENKDDSGEE
eukprot:75125_1